MNSDLTPAEMKVLRLLCEGKSDKEIGLSLNIAYGTVRNYVDNIAEKWDTHGRIKILRKALSLNLV